MTVAALLASGGINFGLHLLLLLWYSVQRTWRSDVLDPPPSPPLLPTAPPPPTTAPPPSRGGIVQALTSDCMFDLVKGFDDYVFLRIFVVSLQIFSFASTICIFVLLPINYYGKQLDFANSPNHLLDLFTIANVENSSKRLWVHFSAVYLISGAACWCLYLEYRNIEGKRHRYFRSSPQPHHFTVLVRGIPKSQEQRMGKVVQDYFTYFLGSAYLQHRMVPRARDVPAAFVFLRTRGAAALASMIQYPANPLLWVIEPAPEPHDVNWRSLSTPYLQRLISKYVVMVAALTILFLVPVTFVQGLSQLDQLEKFFPFLKKVLTAGFVSKIITGYLPSLILQIFMYNIPPIMMWLSAKQGIVSYSGIEKSATTKVLYFTILNVFVATVLSGSAIRLINTFLSNPKDIPEQLVLAVAREGTFFITHVLTSGLTGLLLEITQFFPLIVRFFKRHFCNGIEDEVLAPFSYHREIPKVLLFGLLGFTYSVLAPLILPFLLVYFLSGIIIFLNQMLNVYSPKYETAGQYWPIVHNCTIFSLVFMQILAIGIFVLKKLPYAAGCLVPLCIITLLFNNYCTKRFIPMFSNYAAEDLIRRDNADERNLVNAYRDPQFSTDEDGNYTLLSTPEV
uniref:CSC1/OSCA1-like 7TM region domain-containing protein n=1 Tax=Araucaria cunninghamii TaxID=56994 RepID=A0A0D6QUI7_ARACU